MKHVRFYILYCFYFHNCLSQQHCYPIHCNHIQEGTTHYSMNSNPSRSSNPNQHYIPSRYSNCCIPMNSSPSLQIRTNQIYISKACSICSIHTQIQYSNNMVCKKDRIQSLHKEKGHSNIRLNSRGSK